MNYQLSLVIFLPIFMAVLFLFVPNRHQVFFKWASIATTLLQLVISLIIWLGFDGSRIPSSWEDAFQFVERVPWIRLQLENVGVLNVDYYVGVDGISAPLVVLTSLILLIGAISSWKINVKVKGYFVLYLILGASAVGCFVALDFFLFYLFFEFMLLPMFFLIGIWGGERRQYASIKFFLYTLIGSLFILVVMIGLFLSVKENGTNTFSLIQMMNPSAYLEGAFLGMNNAEVFGIPARNWAFWFLIIGFAIKLPAVPVHTWLPDAHVEAPTPISVILAGLLLKIGGYGLVRIAFGLFPDVAIEQANWIAIIGVVSILYGGLNAMAQDDLKRLVAYSSVSHMGFVMVGLAALTSQGVSGAVFQMFSHGLLSPALFLLVGVVYERTHDRRISNFSGLANQMPNYTFMVGLFFFASLGLPGLSGFVGELLALLAAFSSDILSAWIGMLSVVGILISAAYFLWAMQRMFFGEYWVRKEEWKPYMSDLSLREWIMLTPLGVLAVVLGVFPSLLLDPIQQSVQFWVDHVFQFAQ